MKIIHAKFQGSWENYIKLHKLQITMTGGPLTWQPQQMIICDPLMET